MNQEMTGLRVLALIAILSIPTLGSAQSILHKWAVTGATLIDGSGAPPVSDAVVVGAGERITCVGRADHCTIPPDARTLDATGKWIIPGLIDTHVHLHGDSEESRTSQLHRFASGITTARDAGTPPHLPWLLSLRSANASGTSAEPRLVVSGLVSKEDMQRYRAADLAALVRRYAADGVDAIKIKEAFSVEELRAIIGAAHEAKLLVWGHATGSGLQESLDAGIDGIAHLKAFSFYARRADPSRPPEPPGAMAWVWFAEDWNYIDEARLRSITDAAIKQGVWFEPNLVIEKHLSFRYPLSAEDAFLGTVPSIKRFIRPWVPIGDQSWFAQRERRQRLDVVYKRQCAFVKDFHQRGGIVITGTDTEQAGVSLLKEVDLLAECGFSRMDALLAATKHAAAALRRSDLGTVEVGKLADLVVLQTDPLTMAMSRRDVWRVMKGGVVHDPAELLRPRLEKYRQDLRSAWITRSAIAGSPILLLAGIIAYRRRGRARG